MPTFQWAFRCKLWSMLAKLVGAIGLEPTTPTMSRCIDPGAMPVFMRMEDVT